MSSTLSRSQTPSDSDCNDNPVVTTTRNKTLQSRDNYHIRNEVTFPPELCNERITMTTCNVTLDAATEESCSTKRKMAEFEHSMSNCCYLKHRSCSLPASPIKDTALDDCYDIGFSLAFDTHLAGIEMDMMDSGELPSCTALTDMLAKSYTMNDPVQTNDLDAISQSLTQQYNLDLSMSSESSSSLCNMSRDTPLTINRSSSSILAGILLENPDALAVTENRWEAGSEVGKRSCLNEKLDDEANAMAHSLNNNSNLVYSVDGITDASDEFYFIPPTSHPELGSYYGPQPQPSGSPEYTALGEYFTHLGTDLSDSFEFSEFDNDQFYTCREVVLDEMKQDFLLSFHSDARGEFTVDISSSDDASNSGSNALGFSPLFSPQVLSTTTLSSEHNSDNSLLGNSFGQLVDAAFDKYSVKQNYTLTFDGSPSKISSSGESSDRQHGWTTFGGSRNVNSPGKSFTDEGAHSVGSSLTTWAKQKQLKVQQNSFLENGYTTWKQLKQKQHEKHQIVRRTKSLSDLTVEDEREVACVRPEPNDGSKEDSSGVVRRETGNRSDDTDDVKRHSTTLYELYQRMKSEEGSDCFGFTGSPLSLQLRTPSTPSTPHELSSPYSNYLSAESSPQIVLSPGGHRRPMILNLDVPLFMSRTTLTSPQKLCPLHSSTMSCQDNLACAMFCMPARLKDRAVQVPSNEIDRSTQTSWSLLEQLIETTKMNRSQQTSCEITGFGSARLNSYSGANKHDYSLSLTQPSDKNISETELMSPASSINNRSLPDLSFLNKSITDTAKLTQSALVSRVVRDDKGRLFAVVPKGKASKFEELQRTLSKDQCSKIVHSGSTESSSSPPDSGLGSQAGSDIVTDDTGRRWYLGDSDQREHLSMEESRERTLKSCLKAGWKRSHSEPNACDCVEKHENTKLLFESPIASRQFSQKTQPIGNKMSGPNAASNTPAIRSPKLESFPGTPSPPVTRKSSLPSLRTMSPVSEQIEPEAFHSLECERHKDLKLFDLDKVRKSVSFAAEVSLHSMSSPESSPEHRARKPTGSVSQTVVRGIQPPEDDDDDDDDDDSDSGPPSEFSVPDQDSPQGNSSNTLTDDQCLTDDQRITDAQRITDDQCITEDASDCDLPPAMFTNAADTAEQGQPCTKSDIAFEIVNATELIVGHFSQSRNLLSKIDLGDSATNTKVSGLVLDVMCPAVMRLIGNGLKAHVRTLFGQYKTSVWQIVQASTKLGPATRDLHYLVKDIEGNQSLDTDKERWSAFVFGLLKYYEVEAALFCNTEMKERAFNDIITALQPIRMLPFKLECSAMLENLRDSQSQTEDRVTGSTKPVHKNVGHGILNSVTGFLSRKIKSQNSKVDKSKHRAIVTSERKEDVGGQIGERLRLRTDEGAPCGHIVGQNQNKVHERKSGAFKRVICNNEITVPSMAETDCDSDGDIKRQEVGLSPGSLAVYRQGITEYRFESTEQNNSLGAASTVATTNREFKRDIGQEIVRSTLDVMTSPRLRKSVTKQAKKKIFRFGNGVVKFFDRMLLNDESPLAGSKRNGCSEGVQEECNTNNNSGSNNDNQASAIPEIIDNTASIACSNKKIKPVIVSREAIKTNDANDLRMSKEIRQDKCKKLLLCHALGTNEKIITNTTARTERKQCPEIPAENHGTCATEKCCTTTRAIKETECDKMPNNECQNPAVLWDGPGPAPWQGDYHQFWTDQEQSVRYALTLQCHVTKHHQTLSFDEGDWLSVLALVDNQTILCQHRGRVGSVEVKHVRIHTEHEVFVHLHGDFYI